MKQFHFLLLLSLAFLHSCIKDDFVIDQVEPTIRIITAIDSVELNTTFQLEAIYLNNIGLEEEINANWVSSDPSIMQVDQEGLITALSIGKANIKVSYDDEGTILKDSLTITVGESTSISNQSSTGVIQTTSSYLLEGSFEYRSEGQNVILDIAEDYQASTALPGLYVYLSNNRNTVSNALEIGKVETFNGAHQYVIENVGFSDYQYIVYFCKPFNVKVGDGEL